MTRSGKPYMMSKRKFDLEDLRAESINSASESGAQFKRQVEIDRLGEGITPRLTSDGLNFHCWSSSLIRLIEWTHTVVNYFLSIDKDSDRTQNYKIRTYIEKSISGDLNNSIEEEDEARRAYQLLRRRFEKHSWSHVMNLFNDLINGSDASANLNDSYVAVKTNVSNLNLALGSIWDGDDLVAMFFHHWNKQFFHEISTPMDAKLSLDDKAQIRAEDILQVAQRFQKRNHTLSLSPPPSVLADSSSHHQHSQQPSGVRFSSQKPTTPARRIPLNQQSVSWAKYHLSPRFPFLHCFERGHWVQDCPRKKAGLPGIPDPRIKNPTYILKKSNVLLHPCVSEVEVEEEDPFIASIEGTPENDLLVLLDSGATHHVLGDLSLFTNITKINLTLSVASAKKHPVEGKGLICLVCPSGNLLLTEALYCPDIPGTVISLGKFMKNDGIVDFRDGVFYLHQQSCIYPCLLHHNRWFLKTYATVSCNAIVEDSNQTATLFHRRLAHISLRTIRKLQKLKCVDGLPTTLLQHNVKLCHACSMAKSQHLPLNSPLRGIVEKPGDVIVADLMGPFPISFDKRLYAMLVQDHYSSLVTVYPLQSKPEVGGCLIDWIRKLNNLTNFNVKRIRTDNAGEFLSHNLKRFFEDSGITHETIIPYEHHQAGKVERMNRTIAEAARSMLVNSGVDVSLWPYAFRQAVWVFNWVTHGTKIKTPYELVTTRKPSLGVLRVFGCKAYMHSLNHRKDLSPKAKEVIHLGVAEDSKGWIFWDPISKQVVRSALVVFDEDNMGTANNPLAHSIEINNLFDPDMINELAYQDEVLEVAAATCSLHTDSPSTYQQAIISSDRHRWEEAMEEELKSLKDMGVWESAGDVNLKQTLGCRWVYTVKQNKQGNITWYKARLVVQGYQQVKGLNFDETFAPTPTFNSLQCLPTITAALGWEIQTFDFTTAYLHSALKDTIYVRAPQGATGLPRVLRLKKALYGLKQEGHCWWNHLRSVLKKVGFESNPEDQSTYTYNWADRKAILWVHVDDGVIGASSVELLSKLKRLLKLELMLKWDDEVRSIVGITIKKTDGGFELCQPALIRKLCTLNASNITASQPLPDMDLVSGKADAIDKEYLSRIGMLLYVAQATRPDIMYAVNFLACFSMNTTDRHWMALDHLISYMRGTSTKSLILKPNQGQDVCQDETMKEW
ncbi:hypothetical protein O181_028285 [Austropuccinia psidii MF-1]|uniref:Integrase catalytic domain-containing protein n=1 Tax=Austropuccinia psidii MF-1 TaxID=1389203 RepID=A0A9Q3CT04_9BASI|nr:hypothetical protein [Austropuccinia psidii MF-1]